MRYVVVYDKKSAGNPILGIHAGLVDKEHVELEDVHPGADPEHYGVVLVSDEVIDQMTVRRYKRDRKGKVQMKPVLREKTKDLVSVADSVLGENILVFGEPYAEVKSVTDMAGKRVRHTALNPEKGIISVGTHSGYFSVACETDTGVQALEMLREEINWEWERDQDGNIVGMKLLKKPPPESQD